MKMKKVNLKVLINPLKKLMRKVRKKVHLQVTVKTEKMKMKKKTMMTIHKLNKSLMMNLLVVDKKVILTI